MPGLDYRISERSEGIKRPILDQAWYEQAAVVIESSYTRPEERLEKLNEIWGEYLLLSKGFNAPPQALVVDIKITDDMFRQAMDNAFQETMGLSLEQVVKYAKEMMKNGTNETQAAAADAEQLG